MADAVEAVFAYNQSTGEGGRRAFHAGLPLMPLLGRAEADHC